MKWSRSCALFAGALWMWVAAAPAAEIRVVGANAIREPFAELASAFEKASGHKVTATWSGTAGVAKRIGDGEVVDLVIVGSDTIERLMKDGKLAAGSRTDFARSRVGVAVRPGLPRPDISTEQAVRQAVLDAGSVAYSSGPSGLYIAELFKRMGIADKVKDKLVLPPPSVQVGEVLARGEADLGFQQISDLVHVKGIQFLGPLPASIQNVTVYAIGVHASSPAPEAARALARFLTSPQARDVIVGAGLEPN